jgi:hypothetical protein
VTAKNCVSFWQQSQKTRCLSPSVILTTCSMASATSGASIALTIGQTVLGSGGVSFHITGRKSYGRAGSLEEAEAAFRAEYEKWQRETGKPT